MIFGLICRQGLKMAGLPDDAAHLETAKTECNFIIQDLWNGTHSKFRTSRGQIVTIADSDEYILNKYFDEMVKNTLQGPRNNPRPFEYLEPEIFFQKIMLQNETSGAPSFYTFGDLVGYDAQLLAASKIVAFSSLASKTTGSINVSSGSDIVTSNTDVFSINDVGLRLQRSGDYKTYKVGKYISPRKIQLVEKYRGVSGSDVAYKLGDVGIQVNIGAFVGGQQDSESLELDGSSQIQTSKTMNTLISISKSDKTGGYITVQDASGNTLGVLAPGETELERQTILFWPTPSSAETLKFRFYMRHPFLWGETERLLIREKWHNLVCYRLEKRLRESFEKQVPQGLLNDIGNLEKEFYDDSEDLSQTRLIPDGSNGGLGDRFFFDKFREDYA